MAFRVARVDEGNGACWAVESADGLRRLSGDYPTTRSFFERGGVDDARISAESGERLTTQRLLSPVTRDAKFLCQATNYADHIREVGGDPAQFVNNILFAKAPSCIVPADADVVKPAHVQLLDYEVELGLVLSKAICGPERITEDNLHEWVGGLVIVNDVTARDVQISHTQFHKSKSYRTFGPVGPWLVILSAEELGRLLELELVLEVDGEVRQKALAKEMLFKPAETLAELSQIMDLDAGDLIATGTPAGVALRPPPAFVQAVAGFLSPSARFRAFLKGQLKRPQYLQAGQMMIATIRTRDGAIDLGRQSNRIVSA